ncbi:MAG: hypothetical protein EP335_05525 [Alphaproteobacteria bacterium]|nr:MAG: hypothetical protein EP335_05525 [Alphaproteobacteria bacterium]
MKAIRSFLAAATCLALAGCAGSGGLLCSVKSDGSTLSDLKAESCKGDESASFALGMAYENGMGTDVDLKAAAHYYKKAATPSSGQTYIYVPPAGHVDGYSMPVTTGPATAGNAEAQYRLGLMYRDGRGVERDLKAARKYLEMAAARQHAGATEALKDLPAS